MQKRRLGKTNHNSSVAIFGAFAVSDASQDQADRILDRIVDQGVNHIDVAPTYGHAEDCLGPWLERNRDGIFLACKTMERRQPEASSELHQSLQKLHVDAFDLYQLHSVTSFDELDQITSPGGALESIIEARDNGLTRYIGITSHGNEAPGILLEAINRFDFDTVLYPINFIQYSNPIYRMYSESLLLQCKERDIGVMTIKSIAKAPWGDDNRDYLTWYRPFTDSSTIQAAVNFVLTQDVTGLCTAGDPQLLNLVLAACQNFQPLSEAEQVELINSSPQFESIF